MTQATNHFDVLIVGAGISGVGAGYHLQQACKDKSFVILENQDSFGGTWITHKYPGIRSDSDLYTFGYKFKPWTSAPIATADEILKYMNEVIEENHLDDHIRYGHQINRAEWNSEKRQWRVDATNLATGEDLTFTCQFLWMCQGYYRHSKGYTPEWAGMDDYQGQIVHPQTWPEDLDYKGKQVLVIGSGATAATIIPAMAEDCSHITMLQRSPTFFIPGRNENELADLLRQLDIPEEWTHEIVRRKLLLDGKMIQDRSFSEPEVLREELIAGARAYLGEDFDVEKHFTPQYRPWQQRIAFVPDGDLFQGITSGKASVVTDEIDRFTKEGVLTQSGELLKADIIITATGFDLCVLGDIDFIVDGKALDFSDSITYRGIMYSDIPNMAWVFGYLRTSWTMRADLIGEFVCRLLNHMKEKGVEVCTPRLRKEEDNMPKLPFIDPGNFNPGYLKRNMHLMPRQGDHEPWVFKQDYYAEKDSLPICDLDDGALVYD